MLLIQKEGKMIRPWTLPCRVERKILEGGKSPSREGMPHYLANMSYISVIGRS